MPSQSFLRSPLRRRALVLVSHLVLVTLGYAAAFVVAFEFRPPREVVGRALETVAVLLIVRLGVLHRMQQDRGLWRHVGLRDLWWLSVAVALGSVLFPVALLLLDDLHGIPPSVFLLEAMFTLGLLAAVRLAARFLHERQHQVRSDHGTRAFIIGAGEAGEQLLRQLQHDSRRHFDVVGLIDDDPAKQGLQLHGVSVLGSADELRWLAAMHRVRTALIAIPSAAPAELRRLVERCVDADMGVKLLPPLQDLITGDVELSQIRDVRVEDLLGRAPVTLDLSAVSPEFAGQVVLISGAGGSIGSELARQVARFNPRRLILLERAESPLYYIHLEVAGANPAVDVVPVLASVTNADRLETIFEKYRPDTVFHAAAYKHVPMLEANAVEGVWNNVLGTMRLARAAVDAGARRFVLISTDKAVNPSCVLGATKLLAERIVLELPALRGSDTDFRVVRFGNVLGSEGSVVPLFQRQLAAGGPLTVTHPDVRRYFMTIPEAVQLVLQASTLPECAGRIALLEMGTQVRIVELAEQLIRLAGLVPNQDVKIVFTGLRPGEKMEEELVAPNETTVATPVQSIRMVERNGTQGTALSQRLRQLIQAAGARDELAVLRALVAMVPEYQPAALGVAPRLKVHAGNGTRPTRRRRAAGNGADQPAPIPRLTEGLADAPEAAPRPMDVRRATPRHPETGDRGPGARTGTNGHA